MIVYPPLMAYNTDNWVEPHSRNYQINHKFQKKDSGYYCWKLRKRKVKHRKILRNYSIKWGNYSIKWGNVYEKTNQELHTGVWKYWYLTYLNSPSEETVFGSDKIKKQHEKGYFKMKKLCLEAIKTLINKLNRLEERKFSEEKYLYYTSTLTLTKSKYFLSYKIKLHC